MESQEVSSVRHRDDSRSQIRDAIFPWSLSLEVPRSDEAQESPPPTASPPHSTIRDSGDVQQLLDARSLGRQSEEPEYKPPPALNDQVATRSETALAGGNPLLNLVPELSHHNSTLSISDDDFSLGDDLRGAMETSAADTSKRFLPYDKLDQILNQERVEKELAMCGLERYSRHIFDDPPHKLHSRRKLLAILALLDKIPSIEDIIATKLHDGHLPFVAMDQIRFPLARMNSKDKEIELSFCREWRPSDREQFTTYQWMLHAPFFKLNTPSDADNCHYLLDDNQILPFIEITDPKFGGFGDVSRVKLHSAHCSHGSSRPENLFFAVKKLVRGRHKQDDANAFSNERKVLRRLNEKNHPHLIRLLATYHYRDDNYLLFPWADGGNLRDLWEQEVLDTTPFSASGQKEKWIAEQLLGLCQGLAVIHKCEFHDRLSPLNGSLDPEELERRKYGRHGDLKPENILWFRAKNHPEFVHELYMGHLKICDFGMTHFHGSQSRSDVDPELVGMSRTYRGPEIDIRLPISQVYDIWTMGCIIIEFVTWHLLGWKGNTDFADRRSEEDEGDIPGYKEDCFFNMIDDLREGRTIFHGARMKQCVPKQFDMLRRHPQANGFTQDLLNYVQERMLRMSPKNRANIIEVVEKLEELNAKCGSLDYMTPRQMTLIVHTPTDLSEIEKVSFRRLSAIEMGQRPTRLQPEFPAISANARGIPPVSDPQIPKQEIREPNRLNTEGSTRLATFDQTPNQRMFNGEFDPTGRRTVKPHGSTLSTEPSGTKTLFSTWGDSTFTNTGDGEDPPTQITAMSLPSEDEMRVPSKAAEPAAESPTAMPQTSGGSAEHLPRVSDTERHRESLASSNLNNFSSGTSRSHQGDQGSSKVKKALSHARTNWREFRGRVRTFMRRSRN